MSSRQVASLIALLKKLRQREGLTVDRLQRNSREADELLRVPALAAHRKPGESADLGAVVDTMVEMATELEPVDRAVIDTALGLGLSNSPALDSDTRPDLTQRRRILLEEWSSRVGGDAPSDTSLRTRLEDDAIEAFAQRLVDTGGSNALDEHRAVGRAVVIGGATIDHQYRVDAFPEFGQERSLAAQSLEERPGGKGLTLAVALARLGFEVDLVSAIGQDAAGDQVLDFLAAEGVGSAFVDRQAERTGRVTILTHKDTGDSFAIAWMNREELMVKRSLALEAIESLTTSDNVLFTLEPRFENIRSVLDALPGERVNRPRVLMIPAPTHVDGQIVQVNTFERIDYVIAHRHELAYFVPQYESTEQRARYLRRVPAVDTVVVCDIGRARAYGDFDPPMDREATAMMVREEAGAREAFAAAFLRQMARLDRRGWPTAERLEDALAWGMASMELSASQPGVVAGMPNEDRIERFLKT